MGKNQLFILYESASGYALFERVQVEEIGIALPAVQQSITDLARFSKLCKFKALLPFESAEQALSNINSLSENEVTPELASFLKLNLPETKPGKKSKFALGVADPRLGGVVAEAVGCTCESNPIVQELLRGIRLHFTRFIKGFSPEDLTQAQLGLSHSYSRAKVKFNVNKVDNMIIQSIALLDQLDKDVNTFAMRVREWYSWHFPELVRVVPDNYSFARLVMVIRHKEKLTDEDLPRIEEVVMDEGKAKEVLEAARMSMGTELSDIDMANVEMFAKRVVALHEYRSQLHTYLVSKMESCAPNLTALIGEQVGARLISHAGSLTNLAKYPASTVQILGAEKALFRALKTKGNTPKYGLIFNSTFIGRAAPKNKGRISRYLANKCSIASRIDAFSEESTSAFGHQLRQQVEERLEFFKTGTAPRKNEQVMRAVIDELGGDVTAKTDDPAAAALAAASNGSTVRPMDADSDSDSDEEMAVAPKKAKKAKKEKKEKKTKKSKKAKKEKK